jgi:peptide/nickel transport system permease protein
MIKRIGRLRGRGSLIVGGALCLLIFAVAAGADLITPRSPVQTRMREAFRPPSWEHWFGTDHLGRDVASRVTHGARISLAIGLATVVVTGAAGTAIGLVSGYVVTLDGPLMRIMDALMAFPAIMLAVGITAAVGPSSTNAVVALSAVYVPRTARVVRASVLTIRRLEYVEAARGIGARATRIVLRHVLPNSLGPLIVQLTFVFAYAVLSEAALSFLGMGTPPPTPTLGNVIADGRDYVREAPWICFYPGMALLLAVLGLNLVGDALRDLLDPRTTTTAL